MEDFSVGKVVGFVVLFFVVFLVSAWLFQGNDFFMYKIFAPKYEQVRRETFEQTKSYNQGVAQELNKQYTEYQSASDAGKQAIAAVVLHQVADYDVEKLPPHLRQFVNQLREDRAKVQ